MRAEEGLAELFDEPGPDYLGLVILILDHLLQLPN